MYLMSLKEELMYRQITYPQHNAKPFVLESYVNPGQLSRTYRVLKHDGDNRWSVIASYRYLKNAVARIKSEKARLEGSQETAN